MKTKFIGFAIALLLSGASITSLAPVHSVAAATNNTNVTAIANENVNAGTTADADAKAKREANIRKLREPAKLLPLLFVPLAVALYLLYRKFSNRAKE